MVVVAASEAAPGAPLVEGVAVAKVNLIDLNIIIYENQLASTLATKASSESSRW